MEDPKLSDIIESELYEGMVIKNYKVLCNLLGMKISDGNTKKSQIKKLERFIRFHKDGVKFVIDEIYSQPLREELKVGNNSKYLKLIEVLMLEYLLQHRSNNELICSKSFLLVELGIVDKNFLDKEYKDMLVTEEYYNKYEMHEFEFRSRTFVSNILDRALKNLAKRCLIDYSLELYICKKEKNNTETWFQANKLERLNYTDLKLFIMKEMGIAEGDMSKYQNMQDVYIYRREQDFYNRLNTLIKSNFGWEKVNVKYSIRYLSKNLEYGISITESELNKMNEIKTDLNDKVVAGLYENAKHRYENMLRKYKNGETTFMPYPNYVDRQKSITDDLAKLGSPRRTKFNSNEKVGLQTIYIDNTEDKNISNNLFPNIDFLNVHKNEYQILDDEPLPFYDPNEI